MAEMKQTPVEWLVQQINARGPIGEDIPTWLKELYEKAKAMEKQQIIEAFKHGKLPPLFLNFDAEQYYNETYGK